MVSLKRVLLFTLKITVSSALIYWAVHRAHMQSDFQVEWASLIHRLFNEGFPALLCAILFGMAMPWLHGLRWLLVIRQSTPTLDVPYLSLVRLTWIGHFFNQVLPSSVGGDAVRVWEAHRLGLKPGPAIQSIVLDRIVSLLGLMILVIVGLPFLSNALELHQLHGFANALWLFMLAVLSSHGLLAFILRWRAPALASKFKIVRWIAHLCVVYSELWQQKSFILLLTVTVFSHTLHCAIFSFIGSAVGFSLPLLTSIQTIPLIMLSSVIPISVAGWGIRENLSIFLLGLYNVAAVYAFLCSVIFGLLLMLVSLPGCVLWWKRKHHL